MTAMAACQALQSATAARPRVRPAAIIGSRASTAAQAGSEVATTQENAPTTTGGQPREARHGPATASFPAAGASRFVSDNRAFVESHRIRGNEVGLDQRTNIMTIGNLLQEISGNHAVAMWGRSAKGFASDPSVRGLIFVMTRMQIQMERYPRWGDLIELKTWFHQDGKVVAHRDSRITDVATGEVLGRATSTWVMVNIKTRRLSKLPEATRDMFASFQMQPPVHAIAREYTRHKLPDLELPAEIVGPIQVARRSDVDMNGHVNNVTYFAWVMETVPTDLHKGGHLYQFQSK